jgi:cytochrome c oxidase subunit 1
VNLNEFITIFAIIGVFAQFIFLFNFVYSALAGRRAPRNPWHSNTLEWTTPVAHIHGNWPGPIPAVHRWPYDYSKPGAPTDFIPQTVSDDDIAKGVRYWDEDYDPIHPLKPQGTAIAEKKEVAIPDAVHREEKATDSNGEEAKTV